MDLSLRPYPLKEGFDEYFTACGNAVHPMALEVLARADRKGADWLAHQLSKAQQQLLRDGVDYRLDQPTPTHTDRFLPFDPLPRLIDRNTWDLLTRGVIQRCIALDALVSDLYGDQRIIRDGCLPEEMVTSSPYWRPELLGSCGKVQRWCAVAAFDLICTGPGEWMVLEENLRRGSGIGYAMAARESSCQYFSWLMEGLDIEAIDAAPTLLRETLVTLAPWRLDPDLVVLTPGRETSAFYEHKRLAEAMGVPVHEANELWVEEGQLWRPSAAGAIAVDIIYRRNEDFYPAGTTSEESILGIPGLKQIWLQGKVAIANPPGTGLASDKLLYSWVPDVIRYYLGEEPIIAQVPTYRCVDPIERSYVQERLETLVVKQVGGAGGVGMLMGPESTHTLRQRFSTLIEQRPRHFIAQPVQHLSELPCVLSGELRPCHVDLRLVVLYGKKTYLTQTAMTRVALSPGSRIVNFSQGGGIKDTWILGSF